MKKYKSVITILLSFSLIGLVGCSEKTSKEQALEKKVSELQKQVEQTKKKQEKGKSEVKKTIVVNVIDPETKNIIKTFYPEQMGFTTNKEKYKQDIEDWGKLEARGTATKPGYDQRNTPDRISANGMIIKGKPRRILEESELTVKVMQASVSGGDVSLPLYTYPSGYKTEEVPQLGEVIVASYTTFFNSSVTGRNRNIELSAAAINNVILGNQDYFSFNTTVGPSDQAHGYQPAKEAIDGKLVDGIGGGICQTSSTLYNAVDKLKVTYIEKHHHSLHVGYVPTGRDATVSYGGADFRFQNTTGVALLLKAYVDKSKGSLTIEIRTSKSNQEIMKK
ncbi:MAG: VanW family protein [Bacillota bacterium]|nr:VanW family protein [Bacillota bacterium]